MTTMYVIKDRMGGCQSWKTIPAAANIKILQNRTTCPTVMPVFLLSMIPNISVP